MRPFLFDIRSRLGCWLLLFVHIAFVFAATLFLAIFAFEIALLAIFRATSGGGFASFVAIGIVGATHA